MGMFDNPASATGIQWADHLGRLLLIEPAGFETGITTSLGEKDAVRADITVLDAADGPDQYKDVLIFPRVLIGQTRSMIGKKVLGRLGQGAAKAGQNPPWKLDDYSAEDEKAAAAYLEGRTAATITSPAAVAEQKPPF